MRGDDWILRPGGPLCACTDCEDIRDEFGVEELSPALIALSEKRQSGVPAFFGGRIVRTAEITGGAL